MLFAFAAFVAAFCTHSQELTINSDAVSWGEDIKLADKNTRYDYLGTIGGEDYYAFGYYSTGTKGHFNKVGFLKVKDGVLISQTKDYIKIPRGSLVETMVLKDELCVIYEQTSKKNKVFELKIIKIDKNTLKQKTDEVLISVDLVKKHYHEVALFHSKDKKNHAAMLMTKDNKSDRMSVHLFYYNSNMKEQWNNSYSPSQDVDMTLLNVMPTSDNAIYILSKQEKEKAKEKNRMYNEDETSSSSCIIAKVTENNALELTLDGTFPSRQAKMFEIQPNKLFIAFNNSLNFAAVEYDFDKAICRSLSGLSHKQGKQKTYWSIDKIIQLDNGNVVTLLTDDYVVIVTERINMSLKLYRGLFTYYGRNFNILCFDVDKNKLLYDKYISRAVTSEAQFPIGHGRYENILLFNDKNDVYAVYNAGREDNDLSNEVFLSSQITLPKQSKKATGNMIKIDETGDNVTVTSIVPCKELGLIFSPAISFKSSGKTIQINAISNKTITFGEMLLP